MTEETTKPEVVEEAVEAEAPEETKEAEVETPEESSTEDVEVPAEFEKLVAEIEAMSVLQLHSLVKVLEKKFGVSAAAVAVAGGGATEAAEEQTAFTVELTSFGESKIGVIKAVKAVLGLGLKEAKDLVESAPVELKGGVSKEDADAMKGAIEEAGGSINLK